MIGTFRFSKGAQSADIERRRVPSVMPAQAGIQSPSTPPLDSRFRGNDEPHNGSETNAHRVDSNAYLLLNSDKSGQGEQMPDGF